MPTSEKITDLDELRIAAEDAAEKVIFQHAYLISQEAKRQIWAQGLPVVVQQGSHIVEIYPDGSQRVIGESSARRVKVPQAKMTLKR
jgi:hypothetical protein